MLLQWPIQQRLGVFVDGCVGRDADNFSVAMPGSLWAAFVDCFADCISLRPQAMRQTFADDGHTVSAFAIEARKVVPFKKRNTEHVEIAGTDVIGFDNRV